LTNIEIYFPAGNKWYKTSTGDVFDGGKVVTYPVKFNEEAPYFLRSGYVVSR
jgi:alpha-glucosidase (family GH31 glycosyl hydrolase)